MFLGLPWQTWLNELAVILTWLGFAMSISTSLKTRRMIADIREQEARLDGLFEMMEVLFDVHRALLREQAARLPHTVTFVALWVPEHDVNAVIKELEE